MLVLAVCVGIYGVYIGTKVSDAYQSAPEETREDIPQLVLNAMKEPFRSAPDRGKIGTSENLTGGTRTASTAENPDEQVIGTPEAVWRKREELDQRYFALESEIKASNITVALMGIAAQCPHFVASRGFELREEERKRFNEAGLSDVYKRLARGEPHNEIWPDVHATDKYEAYVDLLEWGHEANKDIVKDGRNCR